MSKAKETENNFFGGFEAIVNELNPSTNRKPSSSSTDEPEDEFVETVAELGVTKLDKEYDIVEPEEIEEALENGLQEGKREKEEVTSTPSKDDEPAAAVEDVSELGEYEQDVVDFLSDKLSTELGWEIDEEDKPKSVSDLVSMMNDIVEESSKPRFANEDIEKLNEFVANGGDLKDFYKQTQTSVVNDSVDLESETVQKRILTENFSRLGYSKEKIEKFINRYEESGTLQEEAEDALELLKEHNVKKSEELLANQRKFKEEQEKSQQKFFSDVQESIGKLDSIRGIPIPAKEKKELIEYIFKPEADGMTKYQKDYAKDYRNLIESAYFTMKGDSLLQKVTQKATSQAARTLQDKLANKGRRVKNSGGGSEGSQNSSIDSWATVSRQLRRPSNF